MDFRAYLMRQIKDRQMSIREFAEFVDVAPSTVSRAVDEREPKPPGLDFLMKLAKATGERLGTLIDIAYPDYAREMGITPTAQLFAERFQTLPVQLQQVITRLIDEFIVANNSNTEIE